MEAFVFSGNLFFCLVGFIAGILAGTGIVPSGYVIPVLPALVIWQFAKSCKAGRIDLLAGRLLRIVIPFVLMAAAGWITVRFRQYRPPPGDARPVYIEARIARYRKINERVGQAVAMVRWEWDSLDWSRKGGRLVLLAKPDDFRLNRGEIWRFGPVRPGVISMEPRPNGFNPGRFWLSSGVRYEAWIRPGQAVLVKDVDNEPVLSILERWQDYLCDRIAGMNIRDDTQGLLEAILLGERQGLDKEINNQFSRAGIIHVISVSGLHVAIIYLVIRKLFALVGLGRRSFLTSGIGLLLVWIYVGLTGFSAPAIRSGSMITIFEMAGLMRRANGGIQVLAAAALIHLIFDPFAIYSAGAQLSYLAVAGIFLWMPVLSKPGKQRPKREQRQRKIHRITRLILDKIRGSVGVSLSAQSLIIPPLLFWFGGFPLYFLIGNLFLMPVMVFIFYSGIAVLLLDLAGFQSGFIFKVMDFAVRVGVDGARVVAGLPGNYFEPSGLTFADMILYYAVLFSMKQYLARPDPVIPVMLLLLTAAVVASHLFGL
jgi:competence protein ComEC